MIRSNESTDSLTHFLHSVYIPSRLELSASAIEQIDIAVRLFESWAGRPLSVHDLSEDLLRRFLTDYRRSHAAATTNSKRGHLLALWQCAFDEGLLDRPPRRAKIRRAKASPAIPEAWTPEEVGRILEAAAEQPGEMAGLPAADWWRSILLVLYDSGERRGAALKTASSDLSPENGRVIFRETKTGRPRYCALHPDTAEACRQIHDPGRPLMWPWGLSISYLDKRFKRLLERAGVSYGRGRGGCWHKLRRTSGTLVEANGGDGAKHLGNSRQVFEKHYRDPRFFSSDLDRLPRPE